MRSVAERRLPALADRPDHTQARLAAELQATRRCGRPLLDALAERLPAAARRAEIAAVLAAALAAELIADEQERDLVREAARIQEVGKLYVPAELVRRPLAGLDEGERAQLDAHYEHGRDLARGAGVPDRVCGWILHARERWDGAGPTSLAGVDIPLASRIVATTREYLDAPMQPGVAGGDPRAAALARLEAVSGSILDPDLASRAIRLAAADGG